MIYNQIVTWTAFAILAMFVPERVVSKNMFVTTQKGAVTLNFVVPERAAESWAKVRWRWRVWYSGDTCGTNSCLWKISLFLFRKTDGKTILLGLNAAAGGGGGKSCRQLERVAGQWWPQRWSAVPALFWKPWKIFNIWDLGHMILTWFCKCWTWPEYEEE